MCIYRYGKSVVFKRYFFNSVYCSLSYNTSSNKPVHYKGATPCTLVGIQYNAYTNIEYFWQHTVLNCVYRNYEELRHPDNEQIPTYLRPFAAALHSNEDFWMDDHRIKTMLEEEGNKEHHISTVLSFVQSQRDSFELWQRKVTNISI